MPEKNKKTSQPIRDANGEAKTASKRIITIVDTNVYLGTGDEVFSKIGDRDVVMPLAVYQELEKYRSKPDGRGYAARVVIRRLDDLRRANPGVNMSRVGVDVGNGNTLRVEVNHTDQSSLISDLRDESSPDRKILAVAKNLKTETGQDVEIITNDAPLRFIASVFEEIGARPYEPKQDAKFTGVLDVDLDSSEYAKTAVDGGLQIGHVEDEEFDELINELGLNTVPYHSLVKVKQGGLHELMVKDGDTYVEEADLAGERVGPVYGRNTEQRAACRWLNDPQTQIVSLGGVPGAGKSLLAIAYGLDGVERGLYSKVTVFRSMYAVGGQEQGFLKGDTDEKMRPWAQAVWDDVKKYDKLRHKGRGKSAAAKDKTVREAANDMSTVKMPDGRVVPAIEAKYAGVITVEPLTYLRGRTLENQLVIVDDTQSLDRSILLDVISRLGENSKIVFTFDMDQQDNPYLSSGTSIVSLIQRLKGRPEFAHIDFTHSERSKLAQLAAQLLTEFGSDANRGRFRQSRGRSTADY